MSRKKVCITFLVPILLIEVIVSEKMYELTSHSICYRFIYINLQIFEKIICKKVSVNLKEFLMRNACITIFSQEMYVSPFLREETRDGND